MSIAIASEPSTTDSCGLWRRLRELLVQQLRQGLAPRRLALALALGATIGVLPTVWGTSLLCLVCARVLRLNQLLVQSANLLVYPLQILLFAPYLKLGDLLFSGQHLPDSLDNLWQGLQQAPLQVLAEYWQANLQAIGIWLFSVPLLLGICFFLTLPCILRLQRKPF